MERKEECIKIYAETEASSLSRSHNKIPSFEFSQCKNFVLLSSHSYTILLNKKATQGSNTFSTASLKLMCLSFKLGY